MATLPTDGQSNWGDPLNAVINSQAISIANNTTSITNHASNNPADPHGDRAFATGLVNPITSGVNGPNGYVKANGSGFIPSALINGSSATGGMYSSVYDAVTMYGAVANNGLDQSTAIQNAINACSTNGGGIVYLGPGVFSLSNYLVIKNNVWLMMTPNTWLTRIAGGSGNAPYLITNVISFASGTFATTFRITGGHLDGYGSQHVTSAITNLFIWQSTDAAIENTGFYTPFGAGPAIEVNGCSDTWIENCYFDGTTSSGSSTVPAIRVNTSSSSTSPAGFPSYNNASVSGLFIRGCTTLAIPSGHGAFGSLVGSDKVNVSFPNHFYINVIGCSTQYTCTNGAVYQNTATYNNSNWGSNGFFDSGWVNVSPPSNFSLGVLRYRLTGNNSVQVHFQLTVGNSAPTGTVTLFSLPSTAQPSITFRGCAPGIFTNSGTFSNSLYNTRFQVTTGGSVQLLAFPGGNTTGLTEVEGFYEVPLN